MRPNKAARSAAASPSRTEGAPPGESAPTPSNGNRSHRGAAAVQACEQARVTTGGRHRASSQRHPPRTLHPQTSIPATEDDRCIAQSCTGSPGWRRRCRPATWTMSSGQCGRLAADRPGRRLHHQPGRLPRDRRRPAGLPGRPGGSGCWALSPAAGPPRQCRALRPDRAGPPELILDASDPPILGWPTFAWLVVFTAVLAMTWLDETRAGGASARPARKPQPAGEGREGQAVTATTPSADPSQRRL
jgi:hypothetical protein